MFSFHIDQGINLFLGAEAAKIQGFVFEFEKRLEKQF